jgi:hypothetical protein
MFMLHKSRAAAFAAIALLGTGVTQAAAQGCILIRESAPVIGSPSTAYLRPGEWDVDLSMRDSTADRHYSGDVFQAQRTALGTNVINKQKQTIVSLNYAFTMRLSGSISVPFVVASWSIPSPVAPTPGPRATQHGKGIGDISAIGRYWLFDPLKHASRNISLGAGVKMPTGNAANTDTFVDITGANAADKAVDQSVQPGDGGWGTQLEAQGFTRLGRAFLFGSGNYLINPRNMNGTPSILVGIGRPSATLPLRNQNSVPDQFVVRAGAGVPLWKGIGASFSVRVEGVPRYDLIGRSDGFRRPGREVFLEPGITYSRGKSSIQFNLPRGVYRYRAPDPYTGASGDATFPDWVMLGTYSYRFGTVKHVAMPKTPITQPGG